MGPCLHSAFCLCAWNFMEYYWHQAWTYPLLFLTCLLWWPTHLSSFVMGNLVYLLDTSWLLWAILSTLIVLNLLFILCGHSEKPSMIVIPRFPLLLSCHKKAYFGNIWKLHLGCLQILRFVRKCCGNFANFKLPYKWRYLYLFCSENIKDFPKGEREHMCSSSFFLFVKHDSLVLCSPWVSPL